MIVLVSALIKYRGSDLILCSQAHVSTNYPDVIQFIKKHVPSQTIIPLPFFPLGLPSIMGYSLSHVEECAPMLYFGHISVQIHLSEQ